MKSYALQVVIEEDQFEDGRKAFHAHCPALPGCRTWGDTYDEALNNMRDAIDLCIDAMQSQQKPFSPDPQLGAVEVPGPAVVVNI